MVTGCRWRRGADALCVCVQSCWQEYLTARIEQNLVMNCNCPITDCQAQPTSLFFLSILTDKDTIAKVTPASRVTATTSQCKQTGFR